MDDCAPQTPSLGNDSTKHNGGLLAFSDFHSRFHGYVVFVICVWGTVANVANVAVLTRRKMASPTNLILTWLAVADVLTMLTCLPTNIHFYILRDKRLPFLATRSVGWIRYFMLHVNLTVAWHTTAIWLTITLAIFRFVFINFPFGGAAFCSAGRAKVAVALVYLSTFLLCVPNYLAVEIQEFHRNTSVMKEEGGGGKTGNSCVTIVESYFAIGDKRGLPYDVNFWIHALFFKLVPCLLLTVLTCLLVKVMHDSHRRRASLESESTKTREHNRTTAMLFAVVCLFLVTELPHGVLALCSIFIGGFHGDVYAPLGDLLDLLALINDSVGFVLYCTMSNKFRRTFVELFCRGSSICGRSEAAGGGQGAFALSSRCESMALSSQRKPPDKAPAAAAAAGDRGV